MLASFGSRFGRRRIWHLRGRVQAHSVSSAAALAGESIPSAVYHAPAMGSMRGTENGSHGVPGRFKSPIVPPVEGVLRAPIAPRHLSDNTAAEAFHEMLSRQGVDHIFGYPGGAIVPAFGAIYTSKQFRCIIPRHEQGAGHMAQGYARISGKPGVVLSSSGASATNLITSMMDAFADGTPMVVFCGHFNTHSTAVNGYDGPDVLALSQPCTKWNVAVRDVEDISRRIDEAFKIATSGRPGPVLVDLPIKPTSGLYKWPIPSASPGPSHALSPAQVSVTKCRQHEAARSIRHAAGLINMSSKPIIYAGQGILATPKGPRLLRELSEKASIPVTTTLQGLGAFDEEDPKALHMLGLHGSGYANMAIQNADLIIALGARFDDRVTGSIPKFAPKARLAEGSGRGGIIHFDISPKNINKVVQATVPVVGECAENLERLLPQVSPSRRPEWMSQIQAWKAKYPFTAFHHTGRNGAILPQTVIERLSETVDPIKDRTIITTGVGQHQMWAAQHFRWRYPRTMVTSGGLGTMGYGLPAAIGAKAARPDALVIDIDGDASFNMTLNELSTASQFGIDVKVLLLNNEEQGMVTHLQTVYYASRFCHSHNLNPEFVATARAMGIQAESCSSQANIDTKLKWLLETEGPALLEVKVAPKSLSLPMVPAGKGLDEFQFYTD